MSVGAHSTIEYLSQKLLQRWVPKWYEAFTDGAGDGFHERVGRGFKPVSTGQHRILTQCRQLSVYAHAVSCRKYRLFRPDLKKHFDFIVDRYYVGQTGGWLFSLDEDGAVKDGHYDLYAQAFVIFALSHYYRATGDEEAQRLAQVTLDFVDEHFRLENAPGLVEGLDEDLKPLDSVRRHESHMHFLEACLFAAETWGAASYMDMAAELIDLFTGYFYDAESGVLSEYFAADLSAPAPENGHIITEPGHYYEWIWLLKKYELLTDVKGKYDLLCVPLLQWANEKGWDTEYGGIYDELDPEGRVVNDTKRIWPFSEALKANTLMLDSDMDKDELKKRLSDMVTVFKTHYIEERGFWTEWLTRDLQPATDYMPGTTPYHVYFGIMEARDVMKARGKTKSMLSGIYIACYTVRRNLSLLTRSLWRCLRLGV